MIDALARLAPLAIELMHRRAYAHGGYAHHYADGGGMDGQQPQEGSPYGGATQYVQQEPNMNAPQGAPQGPPMAPYAHGGYAHGGHHYMDGGYADGGEGYYEGGYADGGEGHYSHGQMHHYAHGGAAPAAHHMGHRSGHHMPHYGFGGALKGAYNAASGAAKAGFNAAKPQLGSLAQRGANYAGKQAGNMAQNYATKHLGSEVGQQVGQAARTGVTAAAHNARGSAGLGGNYPQPQRPAAPPAPPQAIQTQNSVQEPANEMNELPFAGGYRHGGRMPHRAHGGALYPYVR